jgi:hypothetical protein
MARYKMINGVRSECTAEEVAELDAMKADWDSKAFDRAIAGLRLKRNKLLAETDWMANSDVTISDDWKTYRQALRDLPSGLDTVAKVEAKEFPEKPE